MTGAKKRNFTDNQFIEAYNDYKKRFPKYKDIQLLPKIFKEKKWGYYKANGDFVELKNLSSMYKYLDLIKDKVHEYPQDSCVYEFTDENVTYKTFPEALAASGVDLDVWEVERHVFNAWPTTLKNEKNKPIQLYNVQVKIWFKKKTVDIKQLYKDFLEEVRAFSPKKINHVVPKKKTSDGLLLEIDIFDPHFGKEGIDGDEYNVEIASERFNSAVATLLDRCSYKNNIERILFPIGNDWLHYDTMWRSTTKGTPQNSNIDWRKMWMEGKKAILQAVHSMRELAPVDIVYVPSNHDYQTMFYMADLIKEYYRHDKYINVNSGSLARKYYRFGKVGIALAHGDKIKQADIPMIISSETRRMWHDVDFIEVHLGHFHSQKQIKYLSNDSKFNLTIRYLRSLSALDEWHYESGYVGGLKGCEAFVYDPKHGLVNNLQVNLY